MKIDENFSVRSLDIVIDKEEYDRYCVVILDFIHRNIYIRALCSGPEVKEDLTIVTGSYRIILIVDEEYADEFLRTIIGED